MLESLQRERNVAPPAWLCHENPNGLVSLLSMLQFYAHTYCKLMAEFGAISPLFIPANLGFAEIDPAFMSDLSSRLLELREQCAAIDLRCSVDKIDDILDRISKNMPPGVIGDMFVELSERVESELRTRIFLAIPYGQRDNYSDPLRGWEDILVRFAVEDDVAEARRCLALERYTASVFHLMRVLEVAVLKLEPFLDKADPKAHFGTVINRLQKYLQKTNFPDLPVRVQEKYAFLQSVLPLLQAINDAWRNKVCHADGKIVPTGAYTAETAHAIYYRTLELMRLLASEL